jgi:hypothetical protein
MRALGKIPLFFEHPSSGDSSEGGGRVVVGVMPIFRQLSKLVHNLNMTDWNWNPDPPASLAIAEQNFRAFLATEGYPQIIRWVGRDDVLVDTQRHFWIRDRETESVKHADQQYSEGLKRNLGIALHALCCTEVETFAAVFVPGDDLDRQHHLMGRVLKLSCPTKKLYATKVKNPLRWLALRLRNGRRSKLLEL